MDEKPVKKRARSTLNDLSALIKMHLPVDEVVNDSNILWHVNQICKKNVELKFKIDAIQSLIG